MGSGKLKFLKVHQKQKNIWTWKGGAQMLLWAELCPREIHILKSQPQYLRMNRV